MVKGVLLGFGLGYLALVLGVASGATLPGDHDPIHRAYAAGESLEASQDCASGKITVTVHDEQGTLRRLGAGIISFSRGGIDYDREDWTFNTSDSANDQVIAALNPHLMAGDWTVRVNEASSLSADFKVAGCPTLPGNGVPEQPQQPSTTTAPSRPPTGTWGLG